MVAGSGIKSRKGNVGHAAKGPPVRDDRLQSGLVEHFSSWDLLTKGTPIRPVFGFVLACAMISLVAGGCTTNPATGKREFVAYTTEQEIQIGNEAHPAILSKLGGKTDDATLQEYLTKIGGKITGVCERHLPYEFHVVNAPWPNAMAVPGGNVYMNLGLFPYLDNERQLAAVMGHEVGHAAARHGVKKRQLAQASGIAVKEIWNRVRGKTEFDQAITKASEMVLDMLNKRYSRKNEYEADGLGIRYMGQADYNPWGAVEFLRNLSKTAQKDDSAFDELFYTHPLFPERIAAAEQEVRKAYPDAQPGGTAENAEEFAAMKARAVALLAKFSKEQVEAQKQRYRDGLGRKKGGSIETDDEPTANEGRQEARRRLQEFAKSYSRTAQVFWAGAIDARMDQCLAMTTDRFGRELRAIGPQKLQAMVAEHGRCDLKMLDCVPHKDGTVGMVFAAEYPDGVVMFVAMRFAGDKIDALDGRRMQ